MLVAGWGQKQPASQIGCRTPSESHSSPAKLRSRKAVALRWFHSVPARSFGNCDCTECFVFLRQSHCSLAAPVRGLQMWADGCAWPFILRNHLFTEGSNIIVHQTIWAVWCLPSPPSFFPNNSKRRSCCFEIHCALRKCIYSQIGSYLRWLGRNYLILEFVCTQLSLRERFKDKTCVMVQKKKNDT